ncbi:hypothetical protein PTMSG1_04146 [Pyrenophora teres f. maculata]|nr:hypothetical protein PTMSG1_04146 [Pyrenophora teres f. maculata]
MADAPQVAYDHLNLWVDRSEEQRALAYSYDYFSKEAAAPVAQYRAIDAQYSTILWLRQHYFRISMALAIVIVIGSVAGSVGGVFPVQKASTREAFACCIRIDIILIVHVLRRAIFIAKNNFNPPTIITIDNSYPQNLVGAPSPDGILSAPLATPSDNPNSKLYDCLADTKVNVAGDIMALKAYTIGQCVDALQ